MSLDKVWSRTALRRVESSLEALSDQKAGDALKIFGYKAVLTTAKNTDKATVNSTQYKIMNARLRAAFNQDKPVVKSEAGSFCDLTPTIIPARPVVPQGMKGRRAFKKHKQQQWGGNLWTVADLIFVLRRNRQMFTEMVGRGRILSMMMSDNEMLDIIPILDRLDRGDNSKLAWYAILMSEVFVTLLSDDDVREQAREQLRGGASITRDLAPLWNETSVTLAEVAQKHSVDDVLPYVAIGVPIADIIATKEVGIDLDFLDALYPKRREIAETWAGTAFHFAG